MANEEMESPSWFGRITAWFAGITTAFGVFIASLNYLPKFREWFDKQTGENKLGTKGAELFNKSADWIKAIPNKIGKLLSLDKGNDDLGLNIQPEDVSYVENGNHLPLLKTLSVENAKELNDLSTYSDRYKKALKTTPQESERELARLEKLRKTAYQFAANAEEWNSRLLKYKQSAPQINLGVNEVNDPDLIKYGTVEAAKIKTDWDALTPWKKLRLLESSNTETIDRYRNELKANKSDEFSEGLAKFSLKSNLNPDNPYQNFAEAKEKATERSFYYKREYEKTKDAKHLEASKSFENLIAYSDAMIRKQKLDVLLDEAYQQVAVTAQAAPEQLNTYIAQIKASNGADNKTETAQADPKAEIKDALKGKQFDKLCGGEEAKKPVAIASLPNKMPTTSNQPGFN